MTDYALTIETDENGHSDRNIDYEIKRQKAKEQELGCLFVRIDPDKEGFDILRAINETFRHIKQLTKKTFKKKKLELGFKSDNITKSQALKFIVKKYYLIISNNRNALHNL